MPMDESFGLVPFEFSRVIWVTLEIACLQSWPIYSIEPIQGIVKFRCLQHCVPIGEDKRDALLHQFSQGGNENGNFRHRTLDNAKFPCFDVEEHRRKWREIKRHIVGERTPRGNEEGFGVFLGDGEEQGIKATGGRQKRRTSEGLVRRLEWEYEELARAD